MSIQTIQLDQQHNEFLERISSRIGLSLPATLHVVIQFMGKLHSRLDEESGRLAIATVESGNPVQLRHLDLSQAYSYKSNEEDPVLTYDVEAVLHKSSYGILRSLAENWRLTNELALMRCIWLCFDIISLGFEGRRVLFLKADPSQNSDEDLLHALLPNQPDAANTRVIFRLGPDTYSIESQTDIDDLILSVSGTNLEEDRTSSILDTMKRSKSEEILSALKWLKKFRCEDTEPSSMDSGKRRSA